MARSKIMLPIFLLRCTSHKEILPALATAHRVSLSPQVCRRGQTHRRHDTSVRFSSSC